METEHTVDLESGLWTALFLGELAKAKVDFANHWDLFSTTKTGGHGLFAERSGEGLRAAARVMALWSQEMGDEWLEVEGGSQSVHAYATSRGDDLRIALVNTSDGEAANVTLKIDGKALSGPVEAKRISNFEYFWNPFQSKPEWSLEPTAMSLAVDVEGRLEVPAASFLILSPKCGASSVAAISEGQASLRLLLPEKAEVGLKTRGFVMAYDDSGKPWSGEPLQVELNAQEGMKIYPSQVLLDGPVSQFQIEGTVSGVLDVYAQTGDSQATGHLRWKKVKERPVTVWEFDNEEILQSLDTSYPLVLDRGARPNRAVLAVPFSQTVVKPEANTLLAPRELKVPGPKEAIRGLVGKVGASADLSCEDPDAAIQFVVQSNLDHWIVVGRVPLTELKGGWKDVSFSLKEEKEFQAMEEVYSVRLMLGAEKPVSGRIYVGELGYLMEG